MITSNITAKMLCLLFLDFSISRSLSRISRIPHQNQARRGGAVKASPERNGAFFSCFALLDFIRWLLCRCEMLFRRS